MSHKKTIRTLIVLATLVLVGCTPSGQNTSNSGKIEALDELTYDWGDINIQGGNVTTGFHFKNSGDKPLVLKGMKTSCMCTTAVIELPNGSLSPEFGMHTKSLWTHEVQPGEEFEVEVIFDPLAHGPTGVGPISRSIFLFSSSESNGKTAKFDPKANEMVTTIKATGDVLYEDDYNEKYGDETFAFDGTEHDFGVVKQSGGLVSHDFEFTYNGDDAITVTAVPTSCACVSAEISQSEFEKGEKGILTVTFDPNLHEEPEGKFFKTVTIMTDPEMEKQPEVKIWAEIDLDLGPEAYKLKEDHND